MQDSKVTPAQAALAVVSACPTWGVETVPLERSLGRVLAESVLADREYPPFDRVCMDGIAVSRVPQTGSLMRSLGTQPAGAPPMNLSHEHTCCEVMTGGVLPTGAICVIPYEDLSAESMGFRYVPRAKTRLSAGSNVAVRGEDYAARQELLAAGTVIGAPEIGVLASVGKVHVEVRKLPRIAVVGSGSELVAPEEDPGPWSLRRSNDVSIVALLQSWGLPVVTVAHLPDVQAETELLLSQMLATHDVLITSGGVSMGKFDFIHQVLPVLGVKPVFHGVQQKPGKPMWFGTAPGNKLVFGLPGNPVSALVCLRRYLIPALSPWTPISAWVTLPEPHTRKHSLTEFLGFRAGAVVVGRGSGDFFSMAGTQGFVEIPPIAEGCPESILDVAFHSWSPR